MKLDIIPQGEFVIGMVHTYLGIKIVDLNDSRVDIASMDGPSYFNAGLDRLLLERQLNVCFLGELLCCSRIAFTDQVVHDDEIDVADDLVSAWVGQTS